MRFRTAGILRDRIEGAEGPPTTNALTATLKVRGSSASRTGAELAARLLVATHDLGLTGAALSHWQWSIFCNDNDGNRCCAS